MKAVDEKLPGLGSTEFWELLQDNPARLAAAVCLIDLSNLEEQMQRHPALRAWVNASHEVACKDEESAEFEVKKARARAVLKGGKTPDPSTGKPKTVDVLRAESEVDDGVQEAMEQYLAARHKRGALRAMSSALEDRLQMLIQIAAKHREEWKDYNRRS